MKNVKSYMFVIFPNISLEIKEAGNEGHENDLNKNMSNTGFESKDN